MVNTKDFKVCLLDMDGTIADLYHYPEWTAIITGYSKNPWEEGSRNAKPDPVYRMFRNLKPMIPAEELRKYLNKFDRVVVCTMTPWQAPDEVVKAAAGAKVEWLSEHYPFLNEYIIMKFKDNKNDLQDGFVRGFKWAAYDWVTPDENTTLIDDSESLRESFVGKAIAPYWLDRF